MKTSSPRASEFTLHGGKPRIGRHLAKNHQYGNALTGVRQEEEEEEAKRN